MKELKNEQFSVVPILPFVDLLLQEEKGGDIIPREIRTSINVQRQSEFRLRLISHLDNIFKLIPKQSTMSIPELAMEGIISISNAIQLYRELCDFLDSDKYNKRLILYLPFELLPESTWHSSSEELTEEVGRFVETYLCNWKLMLSVYDVRANFVDGDILESQHDAGTLPRVCKAAHLIPVLIKKGILSLKETIYLIESSDSKILRNSIADTFGVLSDMNLLSFNDLNEMASSSDFLIRSTAVIVKDSLNKVNAVIETKKFDQLVSEIERNFAGKTQAIYYDSERKNKARISWEIQRDIDFLVEFYANEIVELLKNNRVEVGGVINVMNISENDYLSISCLMGIEKFSESISKNEKEKSFAIVKLLIPYMRKLFYSTEKTKDYIEVICNHLYHLGLITKGDVNWFDFNPTRIEKTLTIDDVTGMVYESKINRIISFITNNCEVSDYVLPVLVVYGSKVKGYSNKTADNDIAFFIKPGISLDKKSEIQKLLSRAIADSKIRSEPLEFWLEENNSRLRIIDFDSSDKSFGDSSMVHVLFQSVWFGQIETIKNLFQKLMPNYLKNNTLNNSRTIWLEEMERNILQYRLMHKGYARFYSTESMFKTKHSHEIDGNSIFWFSGYRKLSSKLFIGKVYLPEI